MPDTLTLRSEMRKSYLIQRLNKPMAFDNPFSFGGGIRNGGLRDEVMDLLRGVFSFDYMGASEFEGGAVPAALSFIHAQAVDGQLVAGEHREVYYLAPATYEQDVKGVIDQLLTDERSMRLMERCGLAEALENRENAEESWHRSVGWLELDNGFFLFID